MKCVIPTELPTQKAAGHISVPFTTDMFTTKLGNPSQTMALKLMPREKKEM